MATEKAKTRYEELTEVDDSEDGEEEFIPQVYAPRAIYSLDEKIDYSSLPKFNLRLIQKMSRAVDAGKAQPGQFWMENFPAQDAVTVVPFAGTKVRRYQPDPNSPVPQCQSPTGDYGIGDPGIECAKCSLKDWGPRDPRTGKSQKPPCKDGVSIRAFSLDHGIPVDIEFMGQSRDKGGFIQIQGATKGYTNFAVRLGSEKKSSGNYSWFEPTIEIVPVPEESRETVTGWYQAVRESMEQDIPAVEAGT